MAMRDPISLQRQYYVETAAAYDRMHLFDADEHHVALGWLAASIKLYKFESVLDVGCGTGRCLNFLKQEGISIQMVGVEPVSALRDIGIQGGLNPKEIVEGDALALPFPEKSFDVVCAFAILHHIKEHQAAVAEMCRVARHAVFISDSNGFGQGNACARLTKQFINAVGLWPAFNFIRTCGKGYQYSEGDGIFYSYSLANDIPVLQAKFSDLRFMSTQSSGANLYRTAPHFAVFATGRR